MSREVYNKITSLCNQIEANEDAKNKLRRSSYGMVRVKVGLDNVSYGNWRQEAEIYVPDELIQLIADYYEKKVSELEKELDAIKIK